ncbi:MAG: fumarate hydratase [Archaeoglobales archaeon]|nr:MAG: fumarate hydratase [Archaeoglobales archaeon]
MEFDDVVEKVVEIIRRAETELSEDVVKSIRYAYKNEENEIARMNLRNIIENFEYARDRGIPICQDTGSPTFFVEIGRELCLDFNLRSAIVEGVNRATREIPLRPNSVHPITREVLGNFPEINFDVVEGDELKIAVIMKGAGSENCSRLRMMNPSDVDRIKLFVVDVVRESMGKPCPPIFVGLGIGSTFDGCARLAKKALLRDVTIMNEFEIDILDAINKLGIGAMGMGGRFTALAVLSEVEPCHTASLPVAVNVQCWANRKAFAILR